MESHTSFSNNFEGKRIGANWFRGSPQSIAQRLLGCLFVRSLGGQRLSGIIVEVEAYLSNRDLASHSARGPTSRNRSMFACAGSLYVYSIHSRHCMNVVTEPEGLGSAVLIRALEPTEGFGQMARFRGKPEMASSTYWTPFMMRHLTSGPGRLCESLSIDRSLDGADLLTSDTVWLEQIPASLTNEAYNIVNCTRIGISRAKELPLRWFIDGNQLVSGRAGAHRSGRTWTFRKGRSKLSGRKETTEKHQPLCDNERSR